MTPASSRSPAAPGVLVAAAFLVASLALAPPVFAQVADTTLWQPNSNVAGIVIGGGRAFVWGIFTSFRGAPRSGLASIDLATGRLTDWAPDPDASVNAVAVTADTVYVGGLFTHIAGVDCTYLAAFQISTGELIPRLSTSLVPIFSLAASGSRLYGTYGTTYPTTLFCWDGCCTSVWERAASNAPFVLAGSRLYMVASTYYPAVYSVQAVSATSGSNLSWTALSADNAIRTLALDGNTLYLGGQFSQVGTEMRNKLAALDANTGALRTWNPGAGGVVTCLAAANGVVYAAGGFTAVDGANRNYLAAINGSDGIATSWNPNPGSLVYSVALDGSTVYVGGNFRGVCGQEISFLARMPDSPSPTLLTYFDAEPAAEGVRLRWDFSAAVEALAVERRDLGAGAWEAVPVEIVADAEGSEALDRTAEPGHDYEYRLVATLGGGAEATFGPVAVSVPAAIATSGLVRVAPNPVERAARVVFESARAEPVRLDVLDPAGRTVAVLFEGTAAPGRHEATWDVWGAGRGLVPGVYVVRLRTPGGTTWRRVAFVR
jgi:hypothetical protein